MNELSSLRKNPSRQTCEEMIKRILMTEVLEKGTNQHFKQASDFMTYFESLYPASDSLTKQVQRAVKAMDMPKDSHGYFIINKTSQQLAQEDDLRYLLQKANASLEDLTDCETVFLKVSPSICSFLIDTIQKSLTFENKYVTMVPTSDGILFYTRNRQNLITLLESLMKED